MRRIRSSICRALVAACVCLATAVPLAAQAASSSAAQDGFVAVSPNQIGQEHLPATPLVFAAYAFVWVALVAYVFSLWRRLSRVEQELAEISTKLEAKRR